MRGILIITFLLFSITVVSQTDSTSTGEVVDAEIIIEKDREIKLPIANKLNVGIKSDIRNIQPLSLTYETIEPAFNWPAYKSEVSFEKPVEKVLSVNHQNSVKFGYGNYNSPLFELKYFTNLNKTKLRSSIFHESFQEGPIAGTNSSSSVSDIKISANYKSSSVVLIPELEYQRNGYGFYGNTDRLNSGYSSQEASKAARNHMGLGFTIRGSSGEVSYSIRPQIYNTDQSIEGGVGINDEFGFKFRSSLNLKVDKTINAGFDLDGDASSYSGGIEYDRSLVTIKPWIAHTGNDIKFKGGFGLSTGNVNDSSNGTGFYPFLKSEWSFDSQWTFYGEIESGIRWNDLNKILKENQFLDDSLVLQNTELKYAIGGGIKGSIANNLLLSSEVKWATLNSIPFYIASISDSSRYTLTYDGGNTNILSFDGRISYAASASSNIGVKLNLYNYSTASLEKAWHLPSYVFTLFFSKNVKEKFFINSEIFAIGGIQAPGATAIEVVELKSFVDINLNLDYKATERFSIFLKLNNLTNKEYEKYLGYPVRGASFKVGGKYRF